MNNEVANKERGKDTSTKDQRKKKPFVVKRNLLNCRIA